MELGFVSAIFPDRDLAQVLQIARDAGLRTVELMCWPVGRAERRYAGVTHVDVTDFAAHDASRINDLLQKYGVSIAALGYYPNPLCPDEREADVYAEHLKRTISAAALLGAGVVSTFVGRDHTKMIDDNWDAFERRWPPIVAHAEACGVKIAIENCPMLFSRDEWPGGKNLAVSPRVWREMFRRIPSRSFGLTIDPSHFVLQFMDPVPAVREFADRIFHVHAKDLKILRDQLDERGIFDFGWNVPKLPGLGDVHWPAFFTALTEARYTGPVCIEVEDRAYEGSLDDRNRALAQCRRFLQNYTG